MPYTYTCKKCMSIFESVKPIRKGRPEHCNNCKRKVIHKKNINECTSIFDLSKRTISKVLKRAEMCCSLCGWDRTSLDLHHIIPLEHGGSNNHDNLIAVCPNCHRLAHERKLDIKLLNENNLTRRFCNWKEFYAISNC